MSDSTTNLHVLAFAAHPDDVELHCGGTMIKLAQSGYRTGIVDLTKGELSSNGDLQTRAEETKQASAILGLSARENLGFPDGGITAEGTALIGGVSQCALVVESIRRFRPEIVLAPFWNERHPDHVATSRLVSRAVFFAGIGRYNSGSQNNRHNVLQVIYYQMRFAFRPSFIVNISDVIDQRIEAIHCYKSQLQKDGQAKDGVQTLLNSSGFAEYMESYTRHYGAFIGTQHGEPFLINNSLRLDNPVEHFRLFPGNISQAFPEII